MQSLAERFDVIVPEHPGFGDSDTPDCSIPSTSCVFLSGFSRTARSRTVHLVGVSLGGWIAAELAIRDTRRLASLTLVVRPPAREGCRADRPVLAPTSKRIAISSMTRSAADEMVARLLKPNSRTSPMKNRVRRRGSPGSRATTIRIFPNGCTGSTCRHCCSGRQRRLFPKEYAFEYTADPGAKLSSSPSAGSAGTWKSPRYFSPSLQLHREREIAA